MLAKWAAGLMAEMHAKPRSAVGAAEAESPPFRSTGTTGIDRDCSHPNRHTTPQLRTDQFFSKVTNV